MFRYIFLLLSLAGLARAADNIVLVTLDSVRADRFSLYGYAQATSPALDAAAAKGMVFDQAYSIVPLTFPAHVAILTGKTPFDTGHFLNGQKLSPDAGYLPTVLKKRGYKTAAFLSSAILERTFGGAKDFDIYDDTMTKKALGEDVSERPAAGTVAEALRWLKTAKGPFFLWVHLFDPHAPYDPAEPWAARFAHPYDAEIAQMDAALGDLLRALPRKTSVLIVGDHGEMLGERGEDEHGVLLYQPAIHVPLVLIGPKVKPGRVARPVTILDAYPTLLALAGAPVPAGLPGDNLLGAPPPSRPVLAVSLYGREVFGFLPSLAVIQDGYKLLAYGDRDYKLFDLAKDPHEADNLFLTDRRRLRDMRRIVQAAELPSTIQVALRDEEKKEFTALGYSTPKKIERLVHPEEGLQHEKTLDEVKKLLAAGNNDEAEMRLLTLLDKAPYMTEARTILGKFYMQQGRGAEARAIFTGLSNRQAMNPVVHLGLAQTLIGKGERDQAVEELKITMALDPRNREAYAMLAQIYWVQRKLDALQDLRDSAKRFSVEDPVLFTYLGYLEQARRNYPAAEQFFSAALEMQPDVVVPLKGLASVLHKLDRKAEARALYTKLAGLAPGDRETQYMLGLLAFELDGDRAKAVEHFDRALEGCQNQRFCALVAEARRKIEQGEVPPAPQ